MATILPSQWRSSSLRKSEIEQQVKSGAQVVCDRRKNKANELFTRLKDAEQALVFIKGISRDIEDALAKVKSSSKNDKVKDSAKQLLSLLDEYVKELRRLHSRFANQKIRIISFGSRSQGKSSFTKKYTQLPDLVVSVKEPDNSLDKTGATSRIIHKAGVSSQKPEIKVVLRTQEEILKIVNTCLSKLSPCGLSIQGKTSFSTWSDLYSILSNEKQKEGIFKDINSVVQGNQTIAGFGSMRQTLLEIFKKNSDFSEVNEAAQPHYFNIDEGKPIELEDLPMYNDMQCSTACKYMTVSEIKIYVDLGHNGMFENIEVCDTKGMSADAGGNLWEQELYKIIGNCDAAFSVQMSGGPAVGKADQEFYENLNKERENFKELLTDLELRHYAIINAVDGTKITNIQPLLNMLEPLNISQSIYVGALKDNAIFDGITLNMQDFVDYVIYDMMRSVIINTNTTDQNLLRKCDEYPAKIEKNRNDLILALASFDSIPTKDWDEIIKRILKTKRDEVIVELTEWAKQQNVFIPTSNVNEVNEGLDNSNKIEIDDDDDEDDSHVSISQNAIAQENLQLPDEKHDISVSDGLYKMITGQKADKKVKGLQYEEVIKTAIGSIFDDFYGKTGVEKGKYGSDLVGSAADAGAYIDALAQDIYDFILGNINRMFAPDSKNPGVDTFREELFAQIWNSFSLESFYENEKFSEKVLIDSQKELNSERLKNWAICYNTTGGSEGGTPIIPRPSYCILSSYFKLAENPSEDRLISGQNLLDKEQLKQAVVNSYLYHDYVNRFMEKQRNAAAGKRSLLMAVLADLNHGKFVEELFLLYKLKSPTGYIKKMIDNGMISKDDEKEYEAQQYIESLKTSKTRLVNTVLKI